MTNAIRDIETLKSIEPKQIIAYLKRTGWQKETSIPDKAEIWVLKKEDSDQDCVDILLPLNTSFEDYPLRMSEILVTLEIIEDRSQKEILQDIQKFLIITELNSFGLVIEKELGRIPTKETH